VLQQSQQRLGPGALVAVDGALHQQDPVAGADAGGVDLAPERGAPGDLDLDPALAGVGDLLEPARHLRVAGPPGEAGVVECLAGSLAGFGGGGRTRQDENGKEEGGSGDQPG
jgi:hypothetical protein